MNKNFWHTVKTKFIDFLIEIGPDIVYALASLIIGVFVIKISLRILKRALKKANVELSLKTFVESLSFFVLYGLNFFKWVHEGRKNVL